MTTDSTNRITLGRSGLSVSPICFGTWQLAPKFWGDVPADDVVEAMRRAFEIGVNFYDTADAYGDGRSEEIVGQALKPLPRDQIVVATKVCNHFYPDGRRHLDLSHDYIIAECEASLKRMGMDYVDLYQCHSFDPLASMDEIARAMQTLKTQGKIRAYGSSNWNAEQLRLGDAFGDFVTNQPYYSLLKRDIENDVLPYCEANNTGVLVYSPLHRGLLTDAYQGDETFDDLRKNDPLFQGEQFKAICTAVAKIREIASGYGMSTVQLTVAATLMHPAIHCAITGIKRPAQIEEIAGAMGKTISREHWYEVRNLLDAALG